MMAVVTELVTKFSFKGSLRPLKRYREGLKTAISRTTRFAAATGAAVGAIGALVSANLRNNQALINQASALGLATEELQRLKFAGAQLGVQGDQVTQTLEQLSEKIGEAATKGSEEFTRLGISVRDNVTGEVKSTQEVLSDIQKRFAQGDFSIQQQRSFAEQLGIDAEFVTNLGKSTKSLNELKKAADGIPLINKDDEKQITKFNRALSTSLFTFRQLRTQISIALAPAFGKLSEQFNEFIKDNAKLISQGIARTIGIIGSFIKAVYRVGKAISTVIENTIGWKAAIIGITIALAPLIGGVTGTIAAITAAVAVIDDLIVAFKGGKSVIRDFIKDVTGIDITPVLRGIVQGFKDVFGIVKNILASIVAVFAGIWDLINGDFKGFQQNFTIAFKSLFSGLGDIVRNLLVPFNFVFKQIKSGFSAVTDFFMNRIQNIVDAFNSVKSIFVDQDMSQGRGNAERGAQVQEKLVQAGGINPEFASNDHVENVKVLNREMSKLSKQDIYDLLSTRDIDQEIVSIAKKQLQSRTRTASNNNINRVVNNQQRNMSNVNHNTNQNININVKSTDPSGAAREVKTSLQQLNRQIRDAQLQSSGGGL